MARCAAAVVCVASLTGVLSRVDRPALAAGPQQLASSIRIDCALIPIVADLPALSDQVARPVAVVEDVAGNRAHFVVNEIVVFTREPGELAGVLQRWQGTLLKSIPVIDPSNNPFGPTHLIRVSIPPGEAPNRPCAAQSPANSNAPRVSSEAGLALLRRVLADASLGIPVGLSGATEPGLGIEPGSHREPTGGRCSPGECAPLVDPDALGIPRDLLGDILGIPVAPIVPSETRPPPPPVRRGQSLWIGTYNAQFLPRFAGRNECCDDRPNRASELADRIVASGYDVIALNEMFTGPAKWALVEALSVRGYPHFVQMLDGTGIRTSLEPVDFPVVRFIGRVLKVLPPALRDFCFILRLVPGLSCQDSGLMLFSRYPFVPLPADTHRADRVRASSAGVPWRDVGFVQFDVCSNAKFDCFANKGAGLVRVRHPETGAIFTIVFTHLQAGSTGPASRARQRQFAQIRALIDDTVPDPGVSSQHVILLGDLNTRGDLGNEFESHARFDDFGRPEWHGRFGAGAHEVDGFFHHVLRDAWEFEMHAREVAFEARDRGLSSDVHSPTEFDAPGAPPPAGDDGGGGGPDRLDYVLRDFTLDPATNDVLCYQHLTIAHNLAFSGPGELIYEAGLGQAGVNDLSDHYGVNASVNWWAPFCSSGQARAITAAELNNPAGTAVFDSAEYRIEHPGGMQWFRLDDPGTYSFALYNSNGLPAAEGEVRFRVFLSTSMSTPLGSWNGERARFADSSGQSHAGLKFHVPSGPFYVRIDHPDRRQTGRYTLVVHRHGCTSLEDDCILLPNESEPVVRSLPASAIGFDGSLFFQVATDGPVDDAAQELRFFLAPPPDTGSSEFGRPFALALLTGEGTLIAEAGTVPASGGLELVRRERDDNRQKLFMRVSALVDVATAPTFRVGWSTDLMVLHGRIQDLGDPSHEAPDKHPLKLVANIQARPDVFGVDDEDVELQLFFDTAPVAGPTGFTGGTPLFPPALVPDLGDFDKGQAKALDAVLPCPLGFLQNARAELRVHKPGSTIGLASGLVALPRSTPASWGQTLAIREHGRGPAEGGRYTLSYNLSHGTHNLPADAARRVRHPDGTEEIVCDVRPRP
jgi:hypothetical protein